MKLTKNSEVKIENFEDLQNKNLQLRIARLIRTLLTEKREENKILQNLFNKSVINENAEKCIEYLRAHKIITCVMHTARTQSLLGKHNIEKRERVLKIGKQGFSNNVLSMRFKPRSLYVQRFDQVLLRLAQAGLTSSV